MESNIYSSWEKISWSISFSDPDGRKWTDADLTAKGLSGGGYTYTYKGVNSLWRVPLETMKKLDSENRLHFTNRGGLRLKRYLDENKGFAVQTIWDDIFPITHNLPNVLVTHTKTESVIGAHHQNIFQRRRCSVRWFLRLRHNHRCGRRIASKMDRYRYIAYCHLAYQAADSSYL